LPKREDCDAHQRSHHLLPIDGRAKHIVRIIIIIAGILSLLKYLAVF